MSELIRREDAIKATWKEPSYADPLNVLTEVRDRINALPTASPWHRVEEPPKEEGKYVAINVKTKWWYEASYENGNWKAVDLFGQRWVVIHPTHWMPIEPPKEDA